MPLSPRSSSILDWLMHLFNPPPRQTMSFAQKLGRIVLFCTTLIVLSILLSMAAAVGIFAFEHAHHMIMSTPELLDQVCIIFIGMLVNTLCVMALLAVRRADHKLVPPEPPKSGHP